MLDSHRGDMKSIFEPVIKNIINMVTEQAEAAVQDVRPSAPITVIILNFTSWIKHH